MKEYTIISNINIEHKIKAKSEEEALEKHGWLDMPEGYVGESWELVKIEENGHKTKTNGNQIFRTFGKKIKEDK